MREGFQYIAEHRIVLYAMLKLALLFSAMVAMCVLFVSFAKAFLYTDPEVASRKFAYIVAVSGVGMALGALLVGKKFQKAPTGYMAFGGMSVIGACLLLLALIEQVSPSLQQYVLNLPEMHIGQLYLDPFHLSLRMVYTYALTILMGVAAAFVAIPLQALIHELIPEDKRGKVLGVQFTLLSTCSTLPVLLVGLGSDFIGPRTMLCIIGVPLLLVGLLGLNRRMKHQPGHGNVHPANW
jgi:MFS family permease